MDIWIVLTKSKILPGCPLPSDGSEYMYGRSAIPAESKEQAIDELTAIFKDQGKLAVEEVQKAVIYNPDDWTDASEQSTAVNDAFRECDKTGKIAFGMFISSEMVDG
ncbi:hypothetical protein [Microbulbifer sp. MCCC 1A16149]|uniref:hypothetical protein n=1 Tax=Microbulbifer sp. MCCC 1A16149 TaxID=3411322 RepID=UPI003D0C4F42